MTAGSEIGGEDIRVVVGGTAYRSWITLSVHAAFHDACRSFEFVVAAEQGASATNALFRPGTALQIYAGADLMLDGFVNRKAPRFNPEEALIAVAGRSKGQDQVDCSCLHETGWFENKDPAEIGNALGDFPARFVADGTLDTLDVYQVTPGETVYSAVEDACRDQGKTLCGQPNGDIKITDASRSERHAGALGEGINILEGEAEFSDENRHSETHVRGQKPRGGGTGALRQKAVARDDGVSRHRPHVHHHNGSAKSLGRRATDLRNRKAGNGTRASLDVATWRDEGGTLWTPGHRIFTQSVFLDLAQDMLVESARFVAHHSEGLRCALGLVDPQAYNGKAGKAAKSGPAWSMDASGAE